MRILSIFSLHFEQVFEFKSRIFVWFLVSLFEPILFALFWSGAFRDRQVLEGGWTFPAMASYYFMLIIVGSSLITHHEEDISELDIQKGGLVKYLLKPYSYYWAKFYEELPWRIIQGSFGMIMFLIIFFKLNHLIDINLTFPNLLLSLVVIFLAYMLSFTYKMILGILAFWMTEIRSFFFLNEVIMIILGGYLMPIDLMYPTVAKIAAYSPFAGIIYYPIVAVQGRLSFPQFLQVIAIQAFWLILFIVLYRLLWRNGIKKFSAVGQ
ncbi:ABC-2 family transporter protein [Candidatus Roizmanbacteria bacterium]|nr:ABC-2 family transporter protein [Candidatus Roizmanbacteria bacterium]